MDDLFSHAEKRSSKGTARRRAKGRDRGPPQKPAPPSADGAGRARSYSARDIEVLEGLEPVRRHPGMFIGGTDERGMHHLAAEILDNAMDEAVAGQASRIDLELARDGTLTVTDNGRGIPVDPHPKFKPKSALEVILTTLHSGGKFGGKVYETAGGLHGVGLSVVNALSDRLTVEVARDRRLWSQSYVRGKARSAPEDLGPVQNRRGTRVSFHPDPKVFAVGARFRPALLYRMARSKAYLFRGVEIRWSCAPELIAKGESTPAEDVLHFPGGLSDFLETTLAGRPTITARAFTGQAKLNGAAGKVEWAVAWPADGDGFLNSYCNTVPTPQGGTHAAGFKSALGKGLRSYAELINRKKEAHKITADDVVGDASIMLSVFIENPQFQGQTKERLATVEAQRLVDGCVRDHFDHWLSGDPEAARALLDHAVEQADLRLSRRKERQTRRQSATRRLRLPGKLADCSRTTAEGTEIFLVEGDSAGGSAKQARRREMQAVLPLRGKILNVASASADKLKANQELRDLAEALGCGTRQAFDRTALRYEKVIIMTDADVDGAHIASLLMTFFFKEMTGLIESGHLYLALPPLYRISQGGKTLYARDEDHKEELRRTEFSGAGRIEISRFKGLGEMPAAQLRDTTMDPERRTLLRVTLPSRHTAEEINESRETERLVENLMGRKPELRFAYIQERARFVDHVDV